MPDLNEGRIVFARAHKKSRKGCATCKARKVKCDERRPVCTNCARRCATLTACDFLPPSDETQPHKTLAPRRRRIDSDSSSSRSGGSTSSSNPSHQVITIHPTSLTDDPKYRRLEMRLIYHYTTITSHELPNAGQDDKEQIWAAVVPQFSFESDFVLDGILAFSALHLHALSPSDLEVAAARTKYLVKALDSHRKAVAHIENSNHSQVFTTALFIFHYTWFTEHQAAVEEPYNIPTKVFQLARSSKHFFHSLQYMGLDYYSIYCPENFAIEVQRPHSNHFIESCLVDANRFSAALDGWSTENLETQDILKAVLDHFISVVSVFSTPEALSIGKTLLLLVPIRPSLQYIDVLEAHDPFAMALLARLYAFIHIIDYTWWLHGPVGMELAAKSIRGIAGLMPKEFAWMMEWPLDVADRKILFDMGTAPTI